MSADSRPAGYTDKFMKLIVRRASCVIETDAVVIATSRCVLLEHAAPKVLLVSDTLGGGR